MQQVKERIAWLAGRLMTSYKKEICAQLIKATQMNVSSLQSLEPQFGMLAMTVKQGVSFDCLSG